MTRASHIIAISDAGYPASRLEAHPPLRPGSADGPTRTTGEYAPVGAARAVRLWLGEYLCRPC